MRETLVAKVSEIPLDCTNLVRPGSPLFSDFLPGH